MKRTGRSNDVTVAMPAYNAAGFVGRAVRSTLNALPNEGRLLVFDDCSRDATANIVGSIRDARLTLIRSPKNVGVAEALAHLLDECRTEYFARMDADDFCLPWRFKYQLADGSKDSAALFSSVVNFGPTLKAWKPMRPVGVSASEMSRLLLVENALHHNTLLVKTELLRSVGGYRLTPAEDYELWLRLVADGVEIVRRPIPTVAYRRYAGQMSGNPAWRIAAESDEAVRSSYGSAVRQVLGDSVSSVALTRADVVGMLRQAETVGERWPTLARKLKRSSDEEFRK